MSSSRSNNALALDTNDDEGFCDRDDLDNSQETAMPSDARTLTPSDLLEIGKAVGGEIKSRVEDKISNMDGRLSAIESSRSGQNGRISQTIAIVCAIAAAVGITQWSVGKYLSAQDIRLAHLEKTTEDQNDILRSINISQDTRLESLEKTTENQSDVLREINFSVKENASIMENMGKNFSNIQGDFHQISVSFTEIGDDFKRALDHIKAVDTE